MITATLKAKDFIEDYQKKVRRFPLAMNATHTDLGNQTKTLIKKEIKNEWNIKDKDLNKNFKLVKSFSTSPKRIQFYGIGRGIGIRVFAAKVSSKPVKTDSGKYRYVIKAKIKKSGSQELISGAFGLRGKNKSILARKTTERFPLRKVYGPGLAVMFNDDIKNKAITFVKFKFPIIFDNKVKFFYD